MTSARRVLIVEDDVKIAALIRDALTAAGYEAVIERDGLKAVAQARALKPAAVVLDRGLPGLEGVEVCRRICAFSSAPVLMLTARVEEEDRIEGLSEGAADYICKPFSVRELILRVGNAIRRSEQDFPRLNPYAPFRIDEAQGLVSLDGRDLELTPVEARLLISFIKRPARVFRRSELLDGLHDDFRDVSDRAVDSHIKNLRRKMARYKGAGLIMTIYGVGYRYMPNSMPS